MVSVWVEQLSNLDETRRLSDLLIAAQEEYMPGGPPMSPLTTSYFTFWAFFDACVGRGKETFGTALLALADKIGMDPILRGVIDHMQASRMGVYVHEGVRDGAAYAEHMKYGPTRRYWNDFVHEAYVNYRHEAIFMRGLPDVPKSRPHSRENAL